MIRSFIKVTPSQFKAIVAIWTILGLFFGAGFLWGAFMVVQNFFKPNFRFTEFPLFTIASLLLSILFPFVFVLYYYSRFTLNQQPAEILRWLFIISFPLLLYFWITVFPAMAVLDIVYEVIFFLLHFAVFLKFQDYFNVLRVKN